MASALTEATRGAAVPARRNDDADDLVWISGGTFSMGSDRHYPEEAPAHDATVDGFWIDRTPVTNAQFKQFVRATGHITFAERKPDAKDTPMRCRACSLPVRWFFRRRATRSIYGTRHNGGD